MSNIIFEKIYVNEGLTDIDRDVSEAIEEDLEGGVVDEHGFSNTSYKITIERVEDE